MLAALTTGTLSSVLVFVIGKGVLSLDSGDLLLAIFGSNLGGLIGGTLTLQAEKVSWIKNHILRGALPTWSLLVALYFVTLLGVAPAMRELRNFLWLVFPVIMTSGLMIPHVFGPVQDWLMRRSQKEARKARKQFSLS